MVLVTATSTITQAAGVPVFSTDTGPYLSAPPRELGGDNLNIALRSDKQPMPFKTSQGTAKGGPGYGITVGDDGKDSCHFALRRDNQLSSYPKQGNGSEKSTKVLVMEIPLNPSLALQELG
ncbi:hypothetical protein E2C01_057135 [Portunus trituberculatus]|uniref:Uncharacterized protein n=1 Tax=Portunus trituberculatus TaxID=210409 RepID=A0A5B7H2J1_PORTR|nr:hypothetical protein [Portunus trituberculatus]